MQARTFQIILFCLCIIPIGGCGATPEQQLQAIDQAVTYLQAESAKLDARLALIDGVIAQADLALRDPNIAGGVTEQLLTALQAARAEKPPLLAAKAKADAVLADLKTSCAQLQAGGQVDTASLLALAAKTLGGVGAAVGGPVGSWVNLVSMIIAGIFGTGGIGVAVVKARTLTGAQAELQEAEIKVSDKDTALTEVVEGGEKWKKAIKAGLPEGIDPLTAWKQAMEDAQVSDVNKQEVALRRASIKSSS